MSRSESASDGSQSESTESGGEMEVVGIVRPYEDEPLAHTSDDEEDDEEDQDGLNPDILLARFEGEVSVNEWLVLIGFSRTVQAKNFPNVWVIVSSVRSRFSSIFTLCL